MERVPTININDYRQGKLSAESIAALDKACRDHGFFLLSGHGLDDLMAQMWQQAEGFFEEPQALKQSVRRSEKNPMGYYDRELTKQKRDLKEVFDFKAGGHQSTHSHVQTQWPEDRPEFKQVLSDYFVACTQLAEDTISMVYANLGLSLNNVASDFGSIHTSSMRLNHYPVDDLLTAADRLEVNPLGDMALHHHTDPGSITLLAQDNTGGLQALSKSEGWINIPPKANTFVVNLGDCLQVQTNDHYVAAVHRVVPMSDKNRYSTPFFFQPRFDAVIKPLNEDQVGQPLYREFSWREYIKGRVTDNYADLGEDDIQIARYKMATT